MRDRKHPHRLDPEMYCNPGETVFLTCTSTLHLAADEVAPVVAGKMARMDRLHGTRTRAYVLMPDHLHAVVYLQEPWTDLRKWVRYFKREVARSLSSAGMWQRSYWDRHMRKDEDEETAVFYVLNNPVRAGLCQNCFEWAYSWSWYHEDSKGPPC